MSKLKLLHGISRIRRAKLQTSIDQTVADDIEMLAEWSNNEIQYVINELLRFALAQEEEFQKHKAVLTRSAAQTTGNVKPQHGPVQSAVPNHAAPVKEASAS